MKVTMELTYAQLAALQRAATVTWRLAEACDATEDWTSLASAVRALVAAREQLLCQHCGERPYRRTTRLCDRCHVYVYERGELPEEDVLIASAMRSRCNRMTNV